VHEIFGESRVDRSEHRQLLAAAEDRRQVARERDEARLQVARLQGELAAHSRSA
jgi:hypothetical protein